MSIAQLFILSKIFQSLLISIDIISQALRVFILDERIDNKRIDFK
jgi:hypothetical protein